MAEGNITPAPVVTASAAPVSTAAPAPVAASPAPVVEAPIVVSAPVEASQPSLAAPPVLETATEVPVTETAQAVVDPATEGAKPEDAATEAKPVEGDKATDQPTDPTYTDFKMPDGMSMEAPQIAAFHEILGKHGLSQEAGQELMNFGANYIKSAQEKIHADTMQRQLDVFADTNRASVAEFDKWAGNKRDTILESAKSALAMALPNQKDRAQAWTDLANTGAGNRKSIIQAFANLNKRLSERGAPLPSVPSSVPQGTAADRRYGGKN